MLFLLKPQRKSTLGSTPWCTPNLPEHSREHPPEHPNFREHPREHVPEHFQGFPTLAPLLAGGWDCNNRGWSALTERPSRFTSHCSATAAEDRSTDQERKGHINSRKSSRHRPVCAWDTRRDKQVSTGQCPWDFLLFAVPRGFQKCCVIFPHHSILNFTYLKIVFCQINSVIVEVIKCLKIHSCNYFK